MKHLFLFTCIFLLFGTLSCDNFTEDPAPGDFPAWIKYKVDELSARTGESCEFIYVLQYEVRGRYYYISTLAILPATIVTFSMRMETGWDKAYWPINRRLK